MLGNGIKQTTATTGTGNLTLSVVSGHPTLADVFAINQPFSYTLLDSAGLFLEAGIGYLADATTLVRARVSSTFSGGAYVKESAAALNLSGTTTIICTPHAASMESMLPTVDGQSSIGRMVSSAGRTAVVTTQALVPLRCYYLPFLFRSGGLVTSLAFNVTTAGAAGAVARAGIYACKADGYIGNLLATTGDQAIDATGFKIGTLDAPLSLPPGWYFTAIVMNLAATLTSFTTGAGNVHGGSPLGFVAGGFTAIDYRFEAVAAAVLPDVASLTTSQSQTGLAHNPAVYMVVS